MSKKYVVRANQNPQIFKDVINKDSARTYSIDFSPWAEDNNTVTSVTWTLKSGNAGISGQTLTSNVATALITFSEVGGNNIQVKADTGTEIFVVHLDILVKEPNRIVNDYGLCNNVL